LNNNRQRFDSEELVKKCYSQHLDKVRYKPASKYGWLDNVGLDLLVHYRPYAITVRLQVKTARNGETIGLVLPMPRDFPEHLARELPDYVKQTVRVHARKHSDAMLFVGKVSKRRSEKVVINDIWRESLVIFQLVRDRRKKRKNKGRKN